MEKIINVNNNKYIIKSDTDLTQEQLNNITSKLSCNTCNKNQILIHNPINNVLSPATGCGNVIAQTTKTLTGTGSGGTPPYSYEWYISKPDGTTETSTDSILSYKFNMVGTYQFDSTIRDSCPSGSISCNDTCVMTSILPPITNPNIIPISMAFTSVVTTAPGSLEVLIDYQNISSNNVTIPVGSSFGLFWMNNIPYPVTNSGVAIPPGESTQIGTIVSGLAAGTYLIKPEIPDSSITGACTITNPIYGDVNQDGIITSVDIDVINSIISNPLSATPCQKALGDVNRSATIDISDITIMNNYLNNGISNGYVGRYVVTLSTQTLTITAACPTPTCSINVT